MACRVPVVIGGIERRSVTEVVDLLGVNKGPLMRWVEYCGFQRLSFTKWREDAAELGTNVHKWIERHWRGEEQPTEIDPFDRSTYPEVRVLFESWQAWEWIRDIRPILIEEKIIDEKAMMHGTLDMIADELIGGFIGRWLYDWKTSNTGKPSLEHWIQAAGYILLALSRGIFLDGVCIVVINKKTQRTKEFRKTAEEMKPFITLFKMLHAISIQLDEMGIKVSKDGADAE